MVSSKVQVIVNNCYTKVETENKKLLQALYSHFSVEKEGWWWKAKKGFYDKHRHFFGRASQKLATGLLVKLIDFLDNYPIKYEYIDNREPLKERLAITKFPGYNLNSKKYSYQGQSVRLCLDHGRGVLDLATNAGKTIVAAAIVKSLDAPTLFVAGTKDIVLQTEEVFSETLNRKISVLGVGRKELGYITVCTAQTLIRLVKGKMKELNHFEVLFFDECHHSSSDTWWKIAMKIPARYRFGLSGTSFGGKDDKDWRLIGATGELIKTVSNAELIKRGVSAKPKIVFLKSQVAREVDGTYLEVVKDGIVNDVVRNTQIHALSFSLVKRGHSILILTPRKVHGLNLFTMLSRDNGKFNVFFNWGGVHAFLRKKNLEKFKEEGGVMIATSVYDEGIDIPEINSLILALGGKSHRKVLQRIGRALRKKQEGKNVVTVYDFWDWHNDYLEKHSKGRLKLYLEEGFDVIGSGASVKQWVDSSLKAPIRELAAKMTSRVGKPTTASDRTLSRQELIRKKMKEFKERRVG